MHLILSDSLLVNHTLFKILKKEWQWVQMEGIMQQAIPIDLLAKINDLKSLTVNQNRELKLWVQALRQHQEVISPRLFASVVHEIMNVIHLQGTCSVVLSIFCFGSISKSAKFSIKRISHTWIGVKNLLPGDKIKCNGKELVLGNPLGAEKWVNNVYKIFELKEHPDWVVKIAHNCWLLLLDQKKEHWGVRLVQTVQNIETDGSKPNVSGLDSYGRCVILEKLNSSLASHTWISRKSVLAPEDEKVALVFANHIHYMSRYNITSPDFSLDHLMWDKNSQLKSTRPLKKGPGNYNEWESYCIKLAQENLMY